MAESHGGSVDVDSAHERGTTFTIDIPVDARPFLDAPTLWPFGFARARPAGAVQ